MREAGTGRVRMDGFTAAATRIALAASLFPTPFRLRSRRVYSSLMRRTSVRWWKLYLELAVLIVLGLAVMEALGL